MSEINEVVFYSIDKAIKAYRQFAQRQLVAAGHSITVDQWLILNVIEENPEVLQVEMAKLVFKDKASIARIMELLVSAGSVKRTVPDSDRRRLQFSLTAKGKSELSQIGPLANDYRKKALKGLSVKEINALENSLQKLIRNCHE